MKQNSIIYLNVKNKFKEKKKKKEKNLELGSTNTCLSCSLQIHFLLKNNISHVKFSNYSIDFFIAILKFIRLKSKKNILYFYLFLIDIH